MRKQVKIQRQDDPTFFLALVLAQTRVRQMTDVKLSMKLLQNCFIHSYLSLV
jgi:hypothetical protein